MKMNYKDEMRKLIELVKQQGFDAPLENTLEDLQNKFNQKF